MRRNIELKARVRDLPTAHATARRIGAVMHVKEIQRDTYFAAAAGRLKLREVWAMPDEEETAEEGLSVPAGVPGRAELIWYRREDQARARGSDFLIAPAGDSASLRGVLVGALGIVMTVLKARTVYLHEEVRIHLDDVKGLGSFIEFEAVISERCDDEQAHAKLQNLQSEFLVAPEDVQSRSYADLLKAEGTGVRG